MILAIDPAKKSGICYLKSDWVRVLNHNYHDNDYMELSNELGIYITSGVTDFVIEDLRAFSTKQIEMVGYLKILAYSLGKNVYSYAPLDWQQVHKYYNIEINDEDREKLNYLVIDEKTDERKEIKLKSIKVCELHGIEVFSNDEADAFCMAKFHQLVKAKELVSRKVSAEKEREKAKERHEQKKKDNNKYVLYDKKLKMFIGSTGEMTKVKSKMLYVPLYLIDREKEKFDNKNLVRVKKSKINDYLSKIA